MSGLEVFDIIQSSVVGFAMDEVSGKYDSPSSRSRNKNRAQNREDGPSVSQEDKLRSLVRNLEKSIERAIASSPQVEECLARIRAEGYEVSLVLQATLAFARRGQIDQKRVEELAGVSGQTASFLGMTPLDKKFLRSLKIAIDDEVAES